MPSLKDFRKVSIASHCYTCYHAATVSTSADVARTQPAGEGVAASRDKAASCARSSHWQPAGVRGIQGQVSKVYSYSRTVKVDMDFVIF
jgi:hypothetical protein